MRKLFRELFYVPKYGKVSDKTMVARMVSTIAIVIVCLTAMSLTAYAYFSANITSGSNIIKSATFKTEVTVQIYDSDDNAVDSSEVKIITSDNKSFRVEGLTPNETYKFVVKPVVDETSAKTGFVIVTADGCEETYHTQQLGVDEKVEGDYTASVAFDVTITAAANVTLQAHWGTSSYYDDFKTVDEEFYIVSGEKITLVINGTQPAAENGDEGGDGSNTGETTGTDESTSTTPTETTYTVESGDNLTKIAEKYGVTVNNLKAYNGLTSDTITVGQVLKIPPADYTAPESSTTETTTGETNPRETPSTESTTTGETTTETSDPATETTTGTETQTTDPVTTDPVATTEAEETQPDDGTTDGEDPAAETTETTGTTEPEVSQ